jgi:hypothetical protein
MYQVIAEQIDPTGNTVSTRNLEAIAVDWVTVGNVPGVGSARVRQGGGQVIDIPVSGSPSDFQRVRLFKDGVLTDTLTYANGAVGHAGGQVVNRR